MAWVGLTAPPVAEDVDDEDDEGGAEVGDDKALEEDELGMRVRVGGVAAEAEEDEPDECAVVETECEVGRVVPDCLEARAGEEEM